MEAPQNEDAAVSIADTAHVRAILIATARARTSISYAALLEALGHRFTRPKMRALCKTLDAIDAVAETLGEPELAVLVVRQADELPGEGWWTNRLGVEPDYHGPRTGSEAKAFVESRQRLAFDYWDT